MLGDYRRSVLLSIGQIAGLFASLHESPVAPGVTRFLKFDLYHRASRLT